jgi:hypothetical protein
MDMIEQVFTITGGVIAGSILLRCLIKKCKRDCYDVHTPTPANTPLPSVIKEQQQSHPQPTAPPSYTYYPPSSYSYNSYSSYPQENRFVVYIPPVSQTARYV